MGEGLIGPLGERPIRGPYRIRPSEKFHGGIYEALFARVNPSVWKLPSSHDVNSPPIPTRARRGLSPAAVEGYRHLLAGGPLERVLSPEVR
jgi:hypothetical protein